MAIIPVAFKNAVVALGIDGSNREKHWIGSGFIVGRKEQSNPKLSTFYIITNKHVVKNKSMLYIRFNSNGDVSVKDYKIGLNDKTNKKQFSGHPHPDVDIVAIQITPQTLIEDKSIWGAFDLDDHALTLEQMQSTGVEEGSLVYALGFPLNLLDKVKTPVCRLGCISRISDAFILKQQQMPFLVDAQAFPGNSGGPIINRPENLSIVGTPSNSKANLIGILCAYLPYSDVLISRQTGEVKMLQTENSGITVVYPVDRIRETVELEYDRANKMRLSVNR